MNGIKDCEMDLLNKDQDEVDFNDNKQSDSKESIIARKKKEEYVESFTIHGLTRIFRGTRAESVFWFIMLLIGMGVFIFVVYRLVSMYLRFDIYTEVTQKIALENHFPAITFCNKALLSSYYFRYCGKMITAKHPNHNQPCKIDTKHTVTMKPTSGKIWSNGIYEVHQCYSLGSKMCNTDKHIISRSKHDGVCFTWNQDGSFHDVYAHAFLKFEMTNKTAGAVMAFIHDANIQELDVTNHVVLEPHKTYQLRVSKTSLIRLPDPFPSKCTKKSEVNMFPGKYNRRTCIDSINYINMYKRCGDIMDYHKPYIPQDIVTKYHRKRPIAIVIKCLMKYSQTRVEVTTECPFPCEEMEYQTVTSFNELDKKKDPINSTIFRLSIQLQNVDSYRVIEEKQLFSWDQVLGEVGGLLGLVIGASLISFIEILAYVYLSVIQKCSKVFR